MSEEGRGGLGKRGDDIHLHIHDLIHVSICTQ